MDILQDPFGRRIDYARLSLTDRCNLHCAYCRPKQGEASPSCPPKRQLLTPREWHRLIEVMAELGIRKLKLTGGEPLLYPEFDEVLRIAKQTEGIEQVTLTTNGIKLAEHLPLCKEVGINGINISLDALDEELFYTITGRHGAKQVLAAVQASLDVGIPTKLNAVIIPGINESQILPLAALAETRPLAVRFIEMMPLGIGGRYGRVNGEEIRRRLEEVYGPLTEDETKRGNGPARYLRAAGMKGSIGLIDPVSHAFCGQCNRIRIQSNGDLQLCLVQDSAISLGQVIKEKDRDRLRAAFSRAIRQKPAAHDFENTLAAQPAKSRQMWQIGG
ncbi:MAG: GTP 3',8-cyclase MoaA [Lachnospiraceae bacterium]|nr:GTP 3',8-cyclase MoaA [Lachnospiraceae bacterium]MDY5742075.1 GTP 3',8-cyclase MoaA [Lachnospiraceae bacterium]